MRVVDLVIVIGWLVFWAYWLISARNIKPGRDRGNWFTGIRVAVIILIVILGMVGTTLAITLFGLIAVLVLAGYFIYSAVSEERYLTKVFPDAYPEYKRRSKMLIPFVF